MEEIEDAREIGPVAEAEREVSIVDDEEHAVDPRSVTVARIAGFGTILAIAVVPFVGALGGGADDRLQVAGDVPPTLALPR